MKILMAFVVVIGVIYNKCISGIFDTIYLILYPSYRLCINLVYVFIYLVLSFWKAVFNSTVMNLINI